MKKIISILLLMTFSIGGLQTKADNMETSKATYSVSPIPSVHQTEGINSFFDIRWNPGSTENLGLLITNNSNQPQTYIIEINKARTNKNGIIDYSDSTLEVNTRTYSLTKMIEIPKEVTVNPEESKKVEGTLKIPEKSFNGILMAGLHITEKNTEKKQSNISNKVAYNIPFVVRGNIDSRPKATIKLERVTIDKLSNTQSSLDIQLSNEKATLLKDCKFEAEIVDKNGNSILKQTSQIDITPETTFIYPVKLTDKIKQGNYKILLKIHHAKYEWKFNKDFFITKQEVKEIRERAGIKDYTWVIYVIGCAILAFSVLLFVKYKFYERKL